MEDRKIVLTGGGTGGHVTPHIALLPALAAEGFSVEYIGSRSGIEREMITPLGIPYHGISAGKWRRYRSLRNATDPFRVLKGFGDALAVLRKVRPALVFSKGGFVTVPVTAAARMLGIPVVIHESDLTPGLANRLAMPFARTVCCNFPETLAHCKKKGVVTGTPIREALALGRRGEGLAICGFDAISSPNAAKPVILFMGGSLGAAAINRQVAASLPRLLERFFVIHLCGKGNAPPAQPGYAPFEFVTEELPHLLAVAEVVVSRAGANSLFELLALCKPNILIPLPLSQSRGDQILNAESFARQNFSVVLPEEQLGQLVPVIEKTYAERGQYVRAMRAAEQHNGTANVLHILKEAGKK